MLIHTKGTWWMAVRNWNSHIEAVHRCQHLFSFKRQVARDRVVCSNDNIIADLTISSHNSVDSCEVVKLREMTQEVGYKVSNITRFTQNAVNYNIWPSNRNEWRVNYFIHRQYWCPRTWQIFCKDPLLLGTFWKNILFVILCRALLAWEWSLYVHIFSGLVYLKTSIVRRPHDGVSELTYTNKDCNKYQCTWDGSIYGK